jgi:hypothetical protein
MLSITLKYINTEMTLKELEIGDRFYPKSKAEKATPIWLVHGKPEFNLRHGSATRQCVNLKTNVIENKSCRMEVIKIN